jgi:class 3 adenylate cyclase
MSLARLSATRRRWRHAEEIRKGIVNPVLAEHRGRIVKLMGDGMLAEIPSAVQALKAAIATTRTGD